MLSSYRAVFAAPGSAKFSAAGFLGRLLQGMLIVGVVAMVSQATGRYGLAGALAATVALSVAVCSPQIARLVDRHGQRRVLRPAMLVSVTGVAGLTLAVRQDAPDWLLFVFAAASGCAPGVGAMVRARWAAIYDGEPRLLHSAFALESVVDEINYMVGPVLSIWLCTVWFPEAGPVVAAGFLLAGVLWLSSQHATEPAPHPRGQHAGGSALRTPGLWLLAAVYVFTGSIFGSVDVVTVAFAEEEGHKSVAGLMLAVYAMGSVLAGVVYGLLHVSAPLPRRWLVGICAMALSMIPLQLAGNLPWMAVALFIAGLTVAPTMVTTVGLVERLVPRASLTEGMTWLSTGLSVGIALGSAVAGWGVDTFGAGQAYRVPGAAGALAAVVAFLGYRRLRPRTSGGVHERADGADDEERTDVA
ncbi:MFS transporter [Streptomyces armeniacus]|uniref:MFS transporter n=1 Tax=Streptomyces armeniacus TaxID=83291 RepID=A0A345XP52_9ACTN|nr:MFS transporter [Streptomyces armeniacus]AXK33418.1 MFS transporter [Streptomyces armeniacus]